MAGGEATNYSKARAPLTQHCLPLVALFLWTACQHTTNPTKTPTTSVGLGGGVDGPQAWMEKHCHLQYR